MSHGLACVFGTDLDWTCQPEYRAGMTSQYKALNDASRLAHAELTGCSPKPEDQPWVNQKTPAEFIIPIDDDCSLHGGRVPYSARQWEGWTSCESVRVRLSLAVGEVPLDALRVAVIEALEDLATTAEHDARAWRRLATALTDADPTKDTPIWLRPAK